MESQSLDAYVFDNNRLAPHPITWADGMEWGEYLRQQGYAEEEQVWGQYPDIYIKVYEARRDARAEFPFVAILSLVYNPHRIFFRDLNGLIQFLSQLMPLFAQHSRPEQDTGDALYGTQDAG